MKDKITDFKCGNIKSAKELCSLYYGKNLYLCKVLTLNESVSKSICSNVFKDAFDKIISGEIKNEGDFELFVTITSAKKCRAAIIKQNKNAFRFPQSCALSPVFLDSLKSEHDDKIYNICINLPAVLRFIYILENKLSNITIADILHISIQQITDALYEKDNNIIKISDKLSAITNAAEFNAISEDCAENEVSTEETYENVLRHCNVICKQIIRVNKEKKRKTLYITLGAVLAAGLITLIVVLGLKTDDNSQDISGTDDVDDTVQNNNDDTDYDDESELDYEVIDTSWFEEDTAYYADIEIQDYGTITVLLDQEKAPQTVSNFISLSTAGFYNGLTFHRIMDGFMMQGGDPNGDGTGDAGYNIYGEFSNNGFETNTISHTRGVISMGRGTGYNTASCQFFITDSDTYTADLDGNYAAFGYVTSGLDIVDKICSDAEPIDDNGTISSENQPVITSITIRAEDTAEEEAE